MKTTTNNAYMSMLPNVSLNIHKKLAVSKTSPK